MSVRTESLRTGWNPLGALLVVALAAGLGVAVVAFGKLAVYGLFGFIAFCVFIRYPVLGVFATTILLLLSGLAGVIGPGGIKVAVPITVAKLCGATALLAWATNLLCQRQRWHAGWPAVLMIAFFVWSLVGILFSPNRGDLFPEWIRLGTFVGFFVMAADVLVNSEQGARKIRAYVIIVLVCGALSAGSAVRQYFTPTKYAETPEEKVDIAKLAGGAVVDAESLEGAAAIRVSGRALHSNWLALLLLCTLPLNVYGFMISKTWIGKGLVALAVLLELAALVLTFTRTGFIVGVIVVLFLVAKSLIRLTPHRIAAFGVAAIVAWFLLPDAYKERVLSFGQYTGSRSVQARVGLQEAATGYLLEHPVKGIGLGAFGFRLIEEDSMVAELMRIIVYDFDWNPLHVGVHNLYLQVGAETGLLGLALFLAFFAVTLRKLYVCEKRFEAMGRRDWQYLAASLQASLVAFLVAGVFLHALQQKIFWIVAAAAVALSFHGSVFSLDGPSAPPAPAQTDEVEAT